MLQGEVHQVQCLHALWTFKIRTDYRPTQISYCSPFTDKSWSQSRNGQSNSKYIIVFPSQYF